MNEPQSPKPPATPPVSGTDLQDTVPPREGSESPDETAKRPVRGDDKPEPVKRNDAEDGIPGYGQPPPDVRTTKL